MEKRTNEGGYEWTVPLALVFVWTLAFWLVGPSVEHAASLGSAFGALGTIGTAVALFVGFQQLRLQQDALQGQQKEIADTLQLLTRTADAQDALAQAQEDAARALREANDESFYTRLVQQDLAAAQQEANRIAQRAEQAHRRATLSTIWSGLLSYESLRVQHGQHFAIHGSDDVSDVTTAARQRVRDLASALSTIAGAEEARLREIAKVVPAEGSEELAQLLRLFSELAGTDTKKGPTDAP